MNGEYISQEQCRTYMENQESCIKKEISKVNDRQWYLIIAVLMTLIASVLNLALS